ncbi:hypothetical protein BKA65DRAFT_553381 [Rhexocercosporidium sp. MPI-PUGE-AT-0058]|nr:hypothetical protein BKA65DRAFT_553381 [Rhexocercosporidium sp. MPI-PUGE-AT-0058]
MATASLPGLQAFVADIGLQPIPVFAEADVLNRPIDIYYLYLAERLLALTIEEGDLDIVLPKLKLDGVKPKELVGELLKKFLTDALFTAPFKDGIYIRFCLSTKTLL